MKDYTYNEITLIWSPVEKFHCGEDVQKNAKILLDHIQHLKVYPFLLDIPNHMQHLKVCIFLIDPMSAELFNQSCSNQ